MPSYQPDILCTGNEFVSLPKIFTNNCGIHSVGFVSETLRGCVELCGSSATPLIAPFVEIDSVNLLQDVKTSSMLDYWVPNFQTQNGKLSVKYTIAASMERRGFVAFLEVTNISQQKIDIRAGWSGTWHESVLSSGQTKKMCAVKSISAANNTPATVTFEFIGNSPIFGLSLMSPECGNIGLFSEDSQLDQPDSYRMHSDLVLEPGEKQSFSLYVGVGLEEISAVAASRELALQGVGKIIASTRDWLREHTIHCDSADIKYLINHNSFYNFFYSQAITLDTEEFILTTSRNSSNMNCGIYRDRDAMRWSMPAVLQISWANARLMLLYGLTRQLNNIGVHSKFINGIALEPGLQLDQLCAPIRALDTYVDLTGDLSLLFDIRVQTAINKVQEILADLRHPTEALFETLLRPSGEYSRLPYVCYSNALVCRILEDIAVLYSRIRDMDRADDAMVLARSVRESILNNFIVQGPFGPMFAHSIDLQGGYDFGDDVEGSLVLLAYLNFCKPDDPIYVNTVKWINSEYNPECSVHNLTWSGENDAGFSVIGAINQILANNRSDLLEFLCASPMDNGLAAEKIDRTTGIAINDGSYASCAGYLAFGLRKTVNATVPATAVVVQSKKQKPNEALYHPPPKANVHAKKARL